MRQVLFRKRNLCFIWILWHLLYCVWFTLSFRLILNRLFSADDFWNMINFTIESISEIKCANNNQKIILYYLVDITCCNSKRSLSSNKSLKLYNTWQTVKELKFNYYFRLIFRKGGRGIRYRKVISSITPLDFPRFLLLSTGNCRFAGNISRSVERNF